MTIWTAESLHADRFADGFETRAWETLTPRQAELYRSAAEMLNVVNAAVFNADFIKANVAGNGSISVTQQSD